MAISRVMRRSFVLPVTVCLVLLAAALPAAARGLALTTLEGEETTLADHIPSGQWTLVMVWTTYCGICRTQYPEISAFHDAHRGRDAAVLGVALDGHAALAAVREYVAAGHFTFPTLVAEPDAMRVAFEGATGRTFTGTPTYLLFNPARELVAERSGVVSREALERYIDGR